MRAIWTCIALCFGMVMLAGCGGGGGHGGRHADNPYFGYYFGTFIDVTKGTIGQIFFNVDESGNVGSGGVDTNGSDEPINGTVSTTGQIAVTITNSGTASGNLSASSASTVSGSLTTDKGHTVYFVLLFNPTTLPGGNPSAGYYTGTYTNTTTSATHIIATKIDTSGNVTGMALVNPSGTFEIANVVGTITNSGVLTFSFIASGNTINTLTGDTALANGALSGNFTSSNGANYTLDVNATSQQTTR